MDALTSTQTSSYATSTDIFLRKFPLLGFVPTVFCFLIFASEIETHEKQERHFSQYKIQGSAKGHGNQNKSFFKAVFLSQV